MRKEKMISVIMKRKWKAYTTAIIALLALSMVLVAMPIKVVSNPSTAITLTPTAAAATHTLVDSAGDGKLKEGGVDKGAINYVTRVFWVDVDVGLATSATADYAAYPDVSPSPEPVTNGTGYFKTTITVPSVPEGNYPVTDVDEAGKTASSTFTVEAMSVTLTPNFGPVGSKVKVSGDTIYTPNATYPVRIYWSANNILELAADTLLASLTTSADGLTYSTYVTIPSIPDVTAAPTYYIFAWQDADKDGAVDSGEISSATFTVTFISATVSPYYVKAGTYEFTITVKNDISTSSINVVEITYISATGITFADTTAPTGWLLESHSPPKLKFKGTGGYEISKGASKTFIVKIKIESNAPEGKKYWTVNATNTAGSSSILTNPYLGTLIDVTNPTVSITEPAQGSPYSVGSGKYIWINGTATDSVSGVANVAINDTKFSLVSFSADTGAFKFANNTAILDGRLAVKVTATDKAGNVGSDVVWAIIDNSAPQLRILEVEDDTGLLREKDGTFYMRKGTTKLLFNVTFWDADGISSKVIYINGTIYGIENKTDVPAGGYSVPSSCNLVVVNNITIVDDAYPTKNTAIFGPYYVRRDVVKPDIPTWESYTVFKGGVLIKGLTATDIGSGVDELIIYNGTSEFVRIPFDKLGSAKLWHDPNKKVFVFEDYVILNLTASVGKTLSIKVAATDFAQNKGDNSTVISVFVEGYFYPLELKKGWNLISFPIIPESTAYDTIKTWFLAGKLKYVYGYDPVKGWVLNPSMTHGVGYWVYVEDYDVLLVRGSTTEFPPPPALPVSYELKKGWNLVGYTSIYVRNITDYLGSLEPYSYYNYVYIYDKGWIMIKVEQGRTLSPGTAFWIFMYKDQTLVPPVP